MDNSLPPEPFKDFISTKDSYMDYVKHAVFCWSYWISLIIVFLAGVTWITLFCLGYIIISFIFLWMGQNIVLQERKRLITSWNIVIFYNYFVIFAKASLQLIGCVYYEKLLTTWNMCWLSQMFAIQCLDPLYLSSPSPTTEDFNCIQEHSGLHWDVICFIVIILQRKLFMSCSFSLVVIDLQVQSEFASRGAVLINKELVSKIELQAENEAISWNKVRERVLNLREKQKALGKHIPSVMEHYLVLRSGDQYLFENDPEEEDAGLYVVPTKKRECDHSQDESDSDFNSALGHVNKQEMVVRRRRFNEDMSLLEEDEVEESCTKSLETHDSLARKFSQRPLSDGESSFYSVEGTLKNVSSSTLNEHTGSNASGQATPNLFFPKTFQRENPDAVDAEKSRPHSAGTRADASSSGAGSYRGGLYPAPGLQREGLLCTHLEENNEDSDEENPATAPPTSGVNLIHILSETVRQGPSTTLRNYRKSGFSSFPAHHRRQLAGISMTGASFDFADDIVKTHKQRKVPSRRTSVQLPSSSSTSIQSSQAITNRLKGDGFAHIHCPDTVYEGIASDAVSPRRRASTGDDTYLDKVNSAPPEADPEFTLSTTTDMKNNTLPEYTSSFSENPSTVADKDTQSACITHEQSTECPHMDYTDSPLHPHSAQQIDNECSESEHEEDIAVQEGSWSKIKATCNLVWLILHGLIDQSVRWLNKRTRDYRNIRLTIDQEKLWKKNHMLQRIHQSDKTASPTRKRALSLWILHPHRFKSRLMQGDGNRRSPRHEDVESQTPSAPLKSASAVNTPLPTPICPVNAKQTTSKSTLPRGSTSDTLKRMTGSSKELLKRQQEFKDSRNLLFLFVIAVSNAVIVYSEWMCYALLLLNHLCSATVLSLPYPCMVFLWAMLSVPRPSKRFWVTLITYTEIVIVIKYIFQFRVIDTILGTHASQYVNNQFFPLFRILGIERQDNYAFFDLIQLLLIFLHRGYLKNNGLWQDHSASRKQSLEIARDACVPGAGRIEEEEEEETSRQLTFCSRLTDQLNLVKRLRKFYVKVTDPRLNEKRDVYVYMFITEFLAFLIIIFGYKSFGPSTAMGESAFDFIRRNNIPVPFICMLVVQFLLILVDRALFLRKNVLGKFVFLILQVVAIHAWLFFILPWITRSSFHDSLPPKLLYGVKCFYFGLSAYQIRSGYPRRTMGNFLTENYNYINLILFKCYLIVPFLYEMRNIMDWIWTDTTLALYHWMEVEDIFSKMFTLKCWRRSELEYPTLRSQLRYTYIKYVVGIFWMFLCFMCIWTPLVVSAFIGTTFVVNPPVECKFEVALASFPTIYSFTARGDQLNFLSQENLEHLKACYEYDQLALAYLNYFERMDISDIHMATQSSHVWSITPPHLSDLKYRLGNTSDPLNIHFEMTCRRKVKEIGSNEQVVNFNYQRPLTNKEKWGFLSALNAPLNMEAWQRRSDNPSNLEGQRIGKPIRLSFLAPRYVVARRDRLEELTAVSQSWNNINATVSLMWQKNPETGEVWRWWKLEEHIEMANVSQSYDELCPLHGTRGRNTSFSTKDIIDILVSKEEDLMEDDSISTAQLKKNDSRLRVFSFNERVYDNLFGKVFISYGIIGVYAAYIFVVHRILRVLYSDITYVIQYQELPNVDRILKLCSDIYMVRESDLEERLSLEEDLVARLIYLFRSNESLIKYTRHRRQLLEDYSDFPFPTYSKMTAKNFRENVAFAESREVALADAKIRDMSS